MSCAYEVPSWAGKPPPGLHLDIYKDDKFIQKNMIDEKKCYLFGRNPDLNDFRIDHSSCSRVHAALVYHKHLNISYLVDLGSTHGTFIGSIRLEPHKPTVVQINSCFHFGASTRNYTLREKPKVTITEDLPMSDAIPETEEEIDNLTEYNTANNRKISLIGINENFNNKKSLKRKRVTFNEDEIVINPEDVDPSIGRFRNLVQSTVIPITNKRMRIEQTPSFSFPSVPQHPEYKHILHHPIITAPGLYAGLPSTASDSQEYPDVDSLMLYGSKILPALPNPAPDIEMKPAIPTVQFKLPSNNDHEMMVDYDMSEPKKKKKYAKEMWPARAKSGGFSKNPLGDI